MQRISFGFDEDDSKFVGNAKDFVGIQWHSMKMQGIPLEFVETGLGIKGIETPDLRDFVKSFSSNDVSDNRNQVSK